MGYVNSLIYVRISTVISLLVALPAAYAFSRYRFLGDKHLFFWLLTNRMAPPAVFALPFFQLYSAIGLFDTHIAVALSHCLFNIPLAVWILEGLFCAELYSQGLCFGEGIEMFLSWMAWTWQTANFFILVVPALIYIAI